jgi:hypothetical protein
MLFMGNLLLVCYYFHHQFISLEEQIQFGRHPIFQVGNATHMIVPAARKILPVPHFSKDDWVIIVSNSPNKTKKSLPVYQQAAKLHSNNIMV